MSEETKKSNVKDFVNSILKATPKAPPKEEIEEIPKVELDPNHEASAMIEVYFDLENPEERDVLFEQIVEVPSSIVNDFLVAMMQEDHDLTMRLKAAHELALRGYQNAVAVLEQELEQPNDLQSFLLALDALVQTHKKTFYPRAFKLWQDSKRDAEECLAAMEALQEIDVLHALEDYRSFVKHFGVHAETLLEDQLEIALSALVEHRDPQTLTVIQEATTNIQNQNDLDDDEKAYLLQRLEAFKEMFLLEEK